jgi:hypothetical protein
MGTIRTKLRGLLLGCGVVASTLVAGTSNAQTYGRADIDAHGQLLIVTSTGREIRPAPDSGQAGIDRVAISPDGRAVGWLVLFPNCCTTYPIPLKLVLLVAGKRRTISGNGLPVWEWKFSEDGQYVAIRQAPVHGDAPQHYELRDVRSGRLVDSFEAGSKRGRSPPPWVRIL